MNWLSIRNQFPGLAEKMNGEPLIYLDSAATSQKPQSVIDACVRAYTHLGANVHRGAYELSQAATEAFESTRTKVGDLLGVTDPGEIIFTRGTTESLNLVASTWGTANVKPWNEIVVTRMEHHSNFVPWQQLARRTGAKFHIVDITPQFTLDLDQFQTLMKGKPKVVALTLTSNVLGTDLPIARLATLAKAAGATVVVDAAQAVPHRRVKIADLGPIDFLAFSAHKMCGPTGVGVLWGRRELLQTMPPYHFGGSMISSVKDHDSQWAELPYKFEAGTPNIEGVIGFGAALNFLNELGWDAIHERTQALTKELLVGLSSLPSVRIFGPDAETPRGPVVSFTMEGVHPHDLATFLDAHGIAVRAGHHCAQPLMDRLGVVATVRASVSFTNTEAELQTFVKTVAKARDYFGTRAPRRTTAKGAAV